MRLTEIFGFGGKPYASRKPDASAFLYGSRDFPKLDGMVSVFRTSGGIYVAVHLQNIPKIHSDIVFRFASLPDFPIVSSGKSSYLAFFTDMRSFSEIVNSSVNVVILRNDSEEVIARGIILK